MKTTIIEKCVKVLETYSTVEEMYPIMELKDFKGRNSYWFFKHFPLYEILDAKIMDKFIISKWDGDHAVNSPMMEYST